MLHNVHGTAFGAALAIHGALQAGRDQAYAHAVASRDTAVNHRLADEVVRLRREVASLRRQRDDLARELATSGR